MNYQRNFKYIKVAMACAAVFSVAMSSADNNSLSITTVLDAKAITSDEMECVASQDVDMQIKPINAVISNDYTKRYWRDDEIDYLINQGFFTRDDYNYLTAVGGECCNDYYGFYAVASCVMNRVKSGKYSNIYETVSAYKQFLGYNDPWPNWPVYNKYLTQEVKDAAVNVLLGGESNIGDCTYFRGRVTGYDMWADPDISEFYVWGGNVFFNERDCDKRRFVHNANPTRSQYSGILIFDNSSKQWCFEFGYHFVNGGAYEN